MRQELQRFIAFARVSLMAMGFEHRTHARAADDIISAPHFRKPAKRQAERLGQHAVLEGGRRHRAAPARRKSHRCVYGCRRAARAPNAGHIHTRISKVGIVMRESRRECVRFRKMRAAMACITEACSAAEPHSL